MPPLSAINAAVGSHVRRVIVAMLSRLPSASDMWPRRLSLLLIEKEVMRILLVEDDPILALIAASVLEDEGHQIVGPAYDDEQALNLAETQSADIALVDINLAGHDEGISLARSLLQRYGIASVFVSGQLEVARSNTDAALGLLRKPYEPGDLALSVSIAKAMLDGCPTLPMRLPASLEIFSPGHASDC